MKLIGRFSPVFRAMSALALIVLVGLSAEVRADDVGVEASIKLWLEGDDENSLPALSDLASSGDKTARLLLARIATQDLGPSPFRKSLSGSQARALFRDTTKGARFGRTWLAIEAAGGDPLAQALLQSQLPEPNPDVIAVLFELGEFQAADHPTRIVGLYGNDSMRTGLLSSDVLLDELRPYIAYLTQNPEPRGDGVAALRHIAPGTSVGVPLDQDTLNAAGFLALGFGFGDVSASNRWRPAIEHWVLNSPSMRPLADLCRQSCPHQKGGCAVALLSLHGGYFEAIRLDTPLETAIPQDVFLASPRARLMALRRAALARAETNLDWLASRKDIAAFSQCAADLIFEARSAYR